MNVCMYVFYIIVKYAFDDVMIFSKVSCMSPQKFQSWYKNNHCCCPARFRKFYIKLCFK